MATLIQSKQIQGIVTASVVTGEFLVSGSLVVTGSQSVLGAVTASSISSSFSGDGSGLTGITYSQIGNTPQFVGGNNITITSSSNVITVHAQLDGTGSDAQSLSISGDQLTILGGNTITIPTGSGVSDYTLLTNVPQGIVSSSVQVLGGSGVLSGSKTDISSLNTFSASIQSEVDSLTAATSSYLTSSGSVDFSDVTNKPSGLVSSSTQITITESQISDLSHYTDSDVKIKLDTEGVLSGSLVSQLPSGLISGSTFTDYTSSIQTELANVRTDLITQFTNNDNVLESKITNIQTFTSSIQNEVDSLTSATSSYLTTVPSGTISGSQQIIDSLPSGVISGSSQITITESQISDLSHYTNSDVQSYIDSIGVVSGSVVAELPSGVISGSSQLPSGLISGSTQVIDSLPSGVVSGSSQITISSSQITDLAHTQIPSGTISGSEQLPQGLISGSNQVIDSLPSGVISGSSQITITESQISDLSHTDISSLNTFTSSIQSEVDSLTAATSSYLTSIDSGIVSSSAQVTELLPSGVISGSSQITITESQISDLSHTDISSLNTFTSSIQTQVDGLSSVTSSYLTSSGSVDFSDITSLPSGLVSGSSQLPSGLISGSSQVIEHLPQGTISGSRQITDGSGLVSSSAQVISHLPSGVVSGSFSSSMATAVELLSEVSGANYLESKSVDSRLDTIEGSIGMYYDLSNTVWNQVYIKSGSNQASLTADFQVTGVVPFKFKLNTDRKLHYRVGDIVYINNFDRDTTITALVSSSYETGSREVGFNVVSVNQQTGSFRINDSYWILSRHTAGFVDSASYTEASASFDYRLDVIVASGSGADWNVNLTHIPSGLVSGSTQLTGSLVSTSSLNEVSTSLANTISDVYASSSNSDSNLQSQITQLFAFSSSIDPGEIIDHTTVNINAGDGLDGGGDISSTREIRLNVTSSHFTSGVGDVLTSQGVVKQSTLDDDIVGTDFSQSVDNRIRSVAQGAAPDGTVSGSTQIDITQTQNFTSFSSSIATSIAGASGASSWGELSGIPSGLVSSSDQILGGSGILSGSHPIGNLNAFSESIQSQVDALIAATSSFLTSETDSQTLSIVGDQLTISSGNTVTIPTGSGATLPSGLISSSQQISDFGYVTSSLEAPFNGDRVVSNTLLGELYSQSYNAGTTGSLAEFIEQVFFPVTAPTAEFTDQTSKFNTNLATDGTNLVSVSLTDTVDNSPYTLVLSGTDASSLLAVPTNAESSSWEIRANGDLTSGTYSYNVTVGDSTDATRVYSGRSITIAQADNGTLSTNGTFYIIESATSGVITLSTSGIPGSTAIVDGTYSPNYGSQDATNFTSSNPLISVNSTTGQLSVGSPISGSGNLGGSTITSNITFEDQYGNVGSGSITINVTENSAPDIIFSNSSLLNTNQATGSSGTLVTISFVDSEGDSINHDSFTFTDPSGQLQSTRSGNNYLVTATSDLSASNYTITASVEDIHGFRTNTETHTFTINSADDGTLTGDTSIYIIESAVSGDSFRDATGFGNGNLAKISVSYSPNYGSQVATLTSSNPAIVVDGSGNLTLGVDLSGSVTQSGDSFTSLISWEDQYGNQDSTTITATVFGNQSPSATFTDNGLTDVTAVSGSDIGSLSITDTESNSPFGVTIGGTDGGKFNIIPQNEASSSWIVQPTGSLSVGDYSVQFTVTDSYSEQAILNETISVTSDSDYGVTYIYTNNRGLLSVDDNYLAVMGGATTVNGDTPAEITSYSDNSIIDYLAGNLGSSEIDMGSGFNLTQRLLDSGSDLGQLLSGSDSFVVNPNEQILIIFPSGSDMIGIPTSIGDSYGGSTNGEYILNINTGAGWSSTIEGANIHSFQTDTPINGYSEYFIIGTTAEGGLGGTIEVRLTPSSGSAPV